MKDAEKDLQKQLDDIKNAAKKAERAAEAKAKKAAKAKAEKELLKAISKSGLSMDDVKAKLGIETWAKNGPLEMDPEGRTRFLRIFILRGRESRALPPFVWIDE